VKAKNCSANGHSRKQQLGNGRSGWLSLLVPQVLGVGYDYGGQVLNGDISCCS
jgi:hypothetical protein